MATSTIKDSGIHEKAISVNFSNGSAVSDLGNNVEVLNAYSLGGAYVFQHYFSNTDHKWKFFGFYFSSTTAVKTIADGATTIVVQYMNI